MPIPRILIIDDEPSWCKNLQRGLNCHITTASNHSEASDLVENDIFELVILNIQLDLNITGSQIIAQWTDLLESIRERQFDVIIVTSKIFPPTIELYKLVRLAFKDYKVVDFLIKEEFESKSYQQTVREIIEKPKVQPPAPQDTIEKPNDMLSFAECTELVEHLLAIPSIADGARRATVIEQLRVEIKTNVAYNSVHKTHVFNIVKTCLQYSAGMQNLRDILQFFEGDSIPMQRFTEALNRLLPRG